MSLLIWLIFQNEPSHCGPDWTFLCPADNCKKMGLVFEDAVGIVEVINCKDVKIQVS